MKVIKIPISKGALGKNDGCEKAPDSVVKKFTEEIWCKESEDILPKIEVGNVETVGDLKKDHETIYKKAKENGYPAFYIGGDHSITYPLFKAFSENFENPGLIVFDAHPDVYKEHDFVTHQDWLFYLVEEGTLKKENIVLVGLRNWDPKEIEFLKNMKIAYFTAKNIFKNVENVCDFLMEKARSFDGFYLSIDIDSIDPAFAPGTGYIEPAGLSSRELLYFVQRLKILKNLFAIDLVEINPDKDINELTIKLGARILGELI